MPKPVFTRKDIVNAVAVYDLVLEFYNPGDGLRYKFGRPEGDWVRSVYIAQGLAEASAWFDGYTRGVEDGRKLRAQNS